MKSFNGFVKMFIVAIGLLLISVVYSDEELEGPGVRIIYTEHGCRRFESDVINPDGYILSHHFENPFPAPRIFDIKNRKLIELPRIREMEGLPQPTTAERKSIEYKKLKRLGKLWGWGYGSTVVYYNPKTQNVGLYVEVDETKRAVKENPPCHLCGGPTELVEKYQRYLCRSCRKYVPEKKYLKDITKTYYANYDIAKGKVTWAKLIADEEIQFTGMDSDNGYMYFTKPLYFYKDRTMIDKIQIRRFNVHTKKIDWQHIINISKRSKSEDLTSYSCSSSFFSPDFTKLVFLEYDESCGATGRLKNPPAQAYILDISSKTHFAVNIPFTAYGYAISRDNKYMILASNELGKIHRYNLETKEQELVLKTTRGVYKLILSANEKYLYVFNRYNIELRKFPSLEVVKKTPLSEVFPGVQTLLVTERMYHTRDGRYAAIGVLKKGESKWASSELDDGFYLLELGE